RKALRGGRGLEPGLRVQRRARRDARRPARNDRQAAGPVGDEVRDYHVEGRPQDAALERDAELREPHEQDRGRAGGRRVQGEADGLAGRERALAAEVRHAVDTRSVVDAAAEMVPALEGERAEVREREI